MKSRALQTAADCRLQTAWKSDFEGVGQRPDKANYLHDPWHCTFTALLPTGLSALDSRLSTLDARRSTLDAHETEISQQPRPAVQTFPPAR